MKAQKINEIQSFKRGGNPHKKLGLGEFSGLFVSAEYQPSPVNIDFYIGSKLKVIKPYYFEGCDEGFSLVPQRGEDWDHYNPGTILMINSIIIDCGDEYKQTVIQLDTFDFIESAMIDGSKLEDTVCRLLYLDDFKILLSQGYLMPIEE